ncbi:glycosyltransferase [Pseudoalteromonas sp. XMcav11-Q]|uniref:glycosyltransferase n=1 Tax=Pseudoalteromonas sp. XMcav11-Q TaxID=3136665 RepID=UPI0032C49FBE
MKIVSVFPDYPNEIKGNVCPFFVDYNDAISKIEEVSNSGFVYVNLLGLIDFLKCKKIIELKSTEGQHYVAVNFIRIPKVRFLNYYLKRWLIKCGLKIFKRNFFSPDLIHAHTLVCAAAVKDFRGVNKLYTEHYSWFRDFKEYRYLRSDFLSIVHNPEFRSFGVSQFMAKELSEIAKVNINFFYNPVSFTSLSPRSFLGSGYSVALIGRLEKIKNFELSFKAVEYAAKYLNKNFKIHVVGNGSQINELQLLAESLDKRVNIIFYQTLSRAHTLNVLSSVDALLVSSKIETFSLVTLEAGFSGIPVYSTKCGGPQEIITDSTGVCVDEKVYIEEFPRFINMIDEGYFNSKLISKSVAERFGFDVFLHKYEKIILG